MEWNEEGDERVRVRSMCSRFDPLIWSRLDAEMFNGSDDVSN